MGKKKGGAKNKLARMSEEERARYLQHRADIEEEARRRKQQLICLYMKNKLKREEAFSRLNLAKINQEWRSILRQIKCKQLQNEIIEIEKYFRYALEQKNRIIHRLLCDLDEAEDMYSTLKQSHMENIERLMNIQEQRLDHFRNKFIHEKDSILSKWNIEFDKYKTDHNKSQKQLECIFYGIENIIKNDANEQDEKHLEKIDKIRSEMTIKLENITKSREIQLKSLWNEYQNIINDYFKYTEQFYNEYIDLRQNDDENTQLIRQHCYEITKSTDHINELKLIYNNLYDEYKFQIDYLQNMKNNFNQQYFNMKIQLDNSIKMNREQFKFMSVESHSVIKHLEKIYKKCESIIQLTNICKKYETDYEKILPFGFMKNKTIYQKSISNENELIKSPPDEFKENTIELLMNFENFWIRFNNTKSDCAYLKDEKLHLIEQNQYLMNLLKDYLIDITFDNGNIINSYDRILNRPQSMRIEKIQHIEIASNDDNNRNRNGNTNKNNLIKIQQRRPVTSCIEGNLCNTIRYNELINRKKIHTIIEKFESIKIFRN